MDTTKPFCPRWLHIVDNSLSKINDTFFIIEILKNKREAFYSQMSHIENIDKNAVSLFFPSTPNMAMLNFSIILTCYNNVQWLWRNDLSLNPSYFLKALKIAQEIFRGATLKLAH